MRSKLGLPHRQDIPPRPQTGTAQMALDGPAPLLSLNDRPFGLPAWPRADEHDENVRIEYVADGLFAMSVGRLYDLLDARLGPGGSKLAKGLVDILYQAAPLFLDAAGKLPAE